MRQPKYLSVHWTNSNPFNQTDLTAQIADNDSQIQKLNQENSDLESMKAKTEKQIGEISKFIG